MERSTTISFEEHDEYNQAHQDHPVYMYLVVIKYMCYLKGV